jgi:hypothetical protein
LAEPAPPMKANSSRPALSKAALTPTPWSSSWFQTMSIFGAACRRLEASASPDSTVNSAATPVVDLLPAAPQRVGEALAAVLGQREGVDAGDLGDDRVGHAALLDEPQA